MSAPLLLTNALQARPRCSLSLALLEITRCGSRPWSVSRWWTRRTRTR